MAAATCAMAALSCARKSGASPWSISSCSCFAAAWSTAFACAKKTRFCRSSAGITSAANSGVVRRAICAAVPIGAMNRSYTS